MSASVIRTGEMRVSISREFRTNLASLSRQFAASADRGFKFDKRGQLSSACTTNRLPSSRCASTIQIVRPWESRADTQPQTPTGFFEIVGDYFSVLHLELCSRHCLLFKTRPNDSEQHASNDSSPSQEAPVKIHLLSRHQLCRAGRVFPL